MSFKEMSLISNDILNAYFTGFMEIDHETISTVILNIQLIHESQLSVTGKNIHICNWLTP